MPEQPEDPIAMAERQVREAEARMARHQAMIDELDRDNHSVAAAKARELLATLQDMLNLTREYLRFEQGMEHDQLARGR